MSKFLVNKSSGIIGLFEGRVNIAIGGYAEVADEQAEHADVIQCKTRGWLEITDSVTGEASPEGSKPTPIVIENDKLKGSLTPPVKQEPLAPAAPVVEEAPAEEVAVETKPAAKSKKA
jgi:hypothetical protein